MSEMSAPFDVVIIGAGPGGIAAAVTAAKAGLRVGIVDDGAFTGGQIWRNRGEKGRTFLARHWMKQLDAASDNITWFRQSRVIANPAPLTLLIETPTGSGLLRSKSLVLATGARELFLPFEGWTLPGVLGAGAMQALVKQGLPVKGKRIIVAGTGPLLLAVADLLRSKGAIVPCILEQAPAAKINRFAVSLISTPAKLLTGIALRARLMFTRYLTDSYPTAASPTASGVRVEYQMQGKSESAECDYLACGFNLIPNNELPQLLGCQITDNGFLTVDSHMRTTVSDIFAIGELTGIGGVEKAIIEGRIAAHVITDHRSAADRLNKHLASARNFTRKLEATFALRPELFKLAKPETIICRCEDVRLSVVQQSLSGRDAKLQTRCGMGPCQARVCGPILQRLLGSEPPQVRAPLFPTSIGTLMNDHP